MAKRPPRKKAPPPEMILARGTTEQYYAFLDLMGKMVVHKDDLEARLTAFVDHFQPYKPRIDHCLSAVLEISWAAELDTAGLLLLTSGLAHFARLEAAKTLPPNARVALPELYEIIDIAAEGFADMAEPWFDDEVVERGKKRD